MKTLITLGFLLVAATGIVPAQTPEHTAAGKKSDSDALFTNVYSVSPSFLRLSRSGPGSRPAAETILEQEGITFPEGASAVYNPGKSQLIVRNTSRQMKLVEEIIERLQDSDEKLIHLRYQVVETEAPLFPEAGQEDADPRETGLDPDSGARILSPRGEPGRLASHYDSRLPNRQMLRKALTPKETEALLKEVEAGGRGKIRNGPSVVVRSGQEAEMWIGGLVAGIDAVLHPDDGAIDLLLGFRQGQPSGKPGFMQKDHKVTVPSGHTVAVEQKRWKNWYQTVLVTALIMDSSGREIAKDSAVRKPAESETPAGGGGKVVRDLNREEMEDVQHADELALSGSRKLADGNYKAAVKDFQASLKKLPDHPLVKERRDAYAAQLKNSLHRIEESEKPPKKESAGIEKLRNLLVPEIDFRNTSLVKALGFLEGRSIELDRDSPESDRGIRLVLAEGDSVGGTEITLRLNNVPLGEALGYTLKLANCQYRVEGRTVTVSPVTKADQKKSLFTNTYIVPPSFLTSAPGGNDRGGAAAPDPFVAPAGAEAGLSKRMTAKEVLEAWGVIFGPGSSATYNPGSSTLIVRQVHDQMDLVEAVVQSLTTGAEKQIRLVLRIIETGTSLFPEPEKKDRPPEAQPDPESGARILPSPGTARFPFDRSIGHLLPISKVLTVGEAEALLKELGAGKKAKIRSAPALMARSGQRLEIWIGDTVAEIDPVIGADDLTIDLNLGLTIGKPAGSFGRLATNQVTIWDGQTVAIERKRGKGRYQTALLTARLVDPAGLAIRNGPPAGGTARADPEGEEEIVSLTSQEQEAIQLADEAALRGSRNFTGGKFQEAVKEFHTALKKLPDHPIAAERRDAYSGQFWKALLRAEDPETSAPEKTDREATETEKKAAGDLELKEGERLVIHTVKKGDSLWSIAMRYRTQISRINAANALNGDVLKVGQELRIPAKDAASEKGRNGAVADPPKAPVKKQVFITFRETESEEPFVENINKTIQSLLPEFEATTETGKGDSIDDLIQKGAELPGESNDSDPLKRFLDELSRPPGVKAGNFDWPQSGVVGIFTDPQFQVMIRALKQSGKMGDLLTPPSVLVNSGEPALVEVDGRRWGTVPTIRPDGFAMDLDLYLPRKGEALFSHLEERRPTGTIRIYDGQTVMCQDPRGDGGGIRTIFVTAKLVEPAELPGSGTQAAAASKQQHRIHFTTREVVMKHSAGGDPFGFLLQDSKPPSSKKGSGKTKPVTGIAGIFTDPQFQVVLRSLNQQKGVDLTTAPSVMTEPGKPALSQFNERRFGFVGKMGAEELTIDLELFFPKSGEPVFGLPAETRQSTASVTIWDGQTVAWAEPLGEDGKKIRLVFLTARLVDPADIEIELPKLAEGTPQITPEQEEAAKKASEWASKADRHRKAGNLIEAEKAYIECLLRLPNHPAAGARRKAYLERLLEVWDALRSERAIAGDGPAGLFPDDAGKETGEFVLEADEKLVVYEIRKGDTLFQVARDHGTSVNRVKTVNRLKSDLMKVGDSLFVPIKIRKQLLEAVGAGWEPKPAKQIPDAARSIVIPSVDFRNTPLAAALEVLEANSAKFDRETPGAERGFKFVLNARESVADVKITLKLSNVPLPDAVHYTARLANCDYEIAGRTVTVSPGPQGEPENQKGRERAENTREVDPSDVWYTAYLVLLEGEAAAEAGNALHAQSCFSEAGALFQALQRMHPGFYPNLVNFRIEQLNEKRKERHEIP